MDIQAILPQINNAVNLSNNSIKCGDEFEKILQRVNENADIAEMYDTAMLEKYDLHGGRNVIISKKTLLRMKKDSAFRQKVYKSIEDIPWSGKFTGKGSNGVFIHEDGTGGYYLDFGWEDDEEEKPKSKKTMLLYVDSSEIKNLNISACDESDHAGFQTEVLLSLVGANFNIKKKKGGF